ncbi:glycoside hydrolase [Rhizoclosmatium globosum]|uniref:Glycoside hydrolase n=1 Tax=Rhizoclosmatium globosum TaxID=329046 RepID=A0A1Y2D405_9FUNG|nr:glycoside hydrolase [Rhizoclosmatium globosum]|eukprot:ORY53846.1 glycoside hydrolase [Rhizoclosmatium globosum]
MAAVAQQPISMAWGFGGSALQTEGAWNVDGKEPDVFDAYYTNLGTSVKAPFIAADHYHRIDEDLKILADLGATAYRFSISWSRVLKNCTGEINPQGIAFYNKMINQLLAYKIEPFLTMYHWDLPQTCQDSFGGWASDKIVDAFLVYADVLLANFGDRVNYWLTINEPRANCDMCMMNPKFPPMTTNTPELYMKCMKNSHLIHGNVVKNARAKYPALSKNWKFSIPQIMEWVEPQSDGSSLDKQTQWFYDPCVFGDVTCNLDVTKCVTIDPVPFTQAEKDLMKGTCDFIAVNVYSTVGVSADPISDPTYWPNPNPIGPRKMPKFLYDRYKVPIVLSEIGFHVPNSMENNIQDVIKDTYRVQWWQEAAPLVLEAITVDKVPLLAMLAWSLLDNYEFNTYSLRWGHVAVDCKFLTRTVKDSAKYLKDFFANATLISPFVRTAAPSATASATGSGPTNTGSAAATATTAKNSGGAATVAAGLTSLAIFLLFA